MSEEAVHMMNDTLINEINAIVGENDVLWHLGDFCMGGKYDCYNKARYYRDKIKCKTINLIFGNHDNRCIRDLFNETYDLKMIIVNNQKIVLCHYALAVWDGSHRKTIQLYGHSHSEAESWLEKHMPNRRSMDVGVDNAAKLLGTYRPFTLEDINRLIGGKNGHNVGDHHINPNTPKEEELQ